MSGSVDGFGPVGPVSGEGPPFAVAGPSSVTLDRARSGLGSFTVSNVTGRPVRARLLVLPGTGADAAWFQVAGESERAMPVAGNATVDVSVKPGEKAPAGSYTFALGAALEESPNQVVSGPTVAFDVPEPEKRKIPWWIIAIIVGALVVLGVGALLIFLFTRPPSAPTLDQAPTISGTVEVGSELTVGPGVWNPDDVVRIHTWQACPAAASDEDDGDCENILIGTGDEAETAQGPTYAIGSDVEGLRIRVVETAVVVDPDALPEEGLDDLSGLPQASAPSPMTDPVPPAPVTTAVVPGVVGLSFGDAQETLSQAGFQILRTTSNEPGVCNPPIEDQNPDAGQEATLGSVVGVTTKKPPPFKECLGIILDQEVVIVDELILEGISP